MTTSQTPTTTTTAAIQSRDRAQRGDVRAAGDVAVDVDGLICPGCGEQVQPVPPAFWQVADGLPAPVFSHLDRTPLCRTRTGIIAEPIEPRWLPAESAAETAAQTAAVTAVAVSS